jgi:hypothetical protein
MTPEQIERLERRYQNFADLREVFAMAARYAWLRANLLSFCVQSGRHKSGSTNYMHVPESSYVDAVVDDAMKEPKAP